MTIEELYKLFQKHPLVSTDSRNVIKDSLFFSLKGENFNGNIFAKKALESGAAYAIIDEAEYQISEQYILVENVLIALQQLAILHRKTLKFPFIGITGTNGKTTTKELAFAVLSKKYRTSATKGNLNNHIGVPLTILAINNTDELAIIEMGANHPGEIAELCEISDPDYGIITNVGKAHLEGFLSLENIIKTKTALFRHIENKGGEVFVNIDNPLLVSFSKKNKRILYGTSDNGLVKGKILEMSPFIKLAWGSQFENTINTKLFGKYNFENIMAAVCLGVYFNVPKEMINEAISEYTPRNNRSQVEFRNDNILILDAYNANPTSLSAALENFSELKSDNKIVIIGDMFELGENKEEEHLKIIELLKSKNFDNVYLVGKIFKSVNLEKRYICFETSDEGREYFIANKTINSLIIVKGSRGIQLEKIAEIL
jgi:UDP-N-acetylmuramoyl-tripeptide--D-alanyl-D-alanine ligase